MCVIYKEFITGLELVFSSEFPTTKSWPAIEIAIMKQGLNEYVYAISKEEGRLFEQEKIQSYLQRTSALNYNIEGKQYTFTHGALLHDNHCFIDIKQKPDTRTADWNRWIEPLLEYADELISARVYDYEYECWQITRDPESYELAGRDYRHLPMVWNNLPAPLGEYEIDTSANPGRRVIRDGYVEAVGATMWLGSRFAERTGCDLAQVEQATWLRPEWLPSGALRIEAQRTCFRTAEGREGELQNRLRELLFPAHTK